jgi:cellulose synthase (UDP-forming)
MTTLGEYGSSFSVTLLVLGTLAAMMSLFRRDETFARTVLLGMVTALGWRYIWWRFSVTVQPLAWTLESFFSWTFAVMEGASMVGSSTAALWLCRTCNRSPEADSNRDWWASDPPRVDVYITTYNEELEVLERSIVGAMHIVYPQTKVFVLDDGRREWLAEYCRAHDVAYITRHDNAHAKAGNINNAFQRRMKEPDAPDFIAIFDADFISHYDFVDRALSLFHDPRVGVVQTPQYFFNPDPVQHNLGITEAYPDEQRFFFNHVQPSRDAWGVAMCCGASSVIRASALKEAGGFPTESVTEDYLLTLRFAEMGWKTVYLNEPLSEGLAPEGLREYIVQRTRWCLGMMQILRNVYNPFTLRHRFSLAQRLAVLDSGLFWICTFPFRLAALVCPILYWYFGIIVVDAQVPDIVRYFVPYYLGFILALNWISQGLIFPLIIDAGQVIVAWPITRAVFSGLAHKGPHAFKVTAKGGDRRSVFVQWRLLRPFALMFALTFIGLCMVLLTDYNYSFSAGEGRYVILFWTLYNLMLLGAVMALCVEQPRASHRMRLVPEAGAIKVSGCAQAAWVLELSSDRARVRGPRNLTSGNSIELLVAGVGAVSAQVAGSQSDSYVLRLFPTPEQRIALIGRLHSAGGTPGAVSGSPVGVIRGLARRIWAALRLKSRRQAVKK